ISSQFTSAFFYCHVQSLIRSLFKTMMIEFPKAFFVTGTDTGIGKTFVSAVLLKATGGSYWKPIQSGTLEQTDTEWVKEMTRLPSDHFFDETYKLTQPLSPHASAKIDGTRIDMNAFKLPA